MSRIGRGLRSIVPMGRWGVLKFYHFPTALAIEIARVQTTNFRMNRLPKSILIAFCSRAALSSV
jgi:hypothetical protein